MFHEIPDPIGDMQCVFSVKSSIPFLVESRKFSRNFSEHLFFTEKEVGEYINIPSTLKGDQGYNIFLKRMQVSEMGSLTVFKISSEEYPEMEVFRELLKIPSVVIDYKYIEGGYHKTIFTFHHSQMNEVSRFIFNARRILGNGLPQYLGPNRGLNYVLENAVKAEKVLRVVFSMKAPIADSDQTKALYSAKWARRLRYTDGHFKNESLYRIRAESWTPPEIYRKISEEEGIYIATAASEISRFFSKMLFEKYNPMFYQYHVFDGNDLRISGLVPVSYERTILEIVHEAVKKFPLLDISLNYLSQILPEIAPAGRLSGD